MDFSDLSVPQKADTFKKESMQTLSANDWYRRLLSPFIMWWYFILVYVG